MENIKLVFALLMLMVARIYGEMYIWGNKELDKIVKKKNMALEPIEIEEKN